LVSSPGRKSAILQKWHDSLPFAQLVLSPRPGAARTARPYNDGMQYGIVADDLTGACDVAGRLTHLGYRPVVRVGERGRAAQRSSPDACSAVLVINARSRASSVDGAVALVRAAAEDLERAGRRVIYHKMDSTLRGHWPEELTTLDSLLRPANVLICPAFPARGRFYRRGCLDLSKEERKEFQRSEPACWSTSPGSRLKGQLGYGPHLVRLDVVRRGQKAVRKAVATRKTRYVVFDATRERDLEVIGKAFRDSEARVLWAGSAGLVRYVLPRLEQPESGPSTIPTRPWLLIQGSRQRISHEQFQRLEEEDSVLLLTFRSPRGRKERMLWHETALAALAQRQHVAITVPQDFGASLPGEFAHFLERLLRRIRYRRWLGGVLVSGGNTAEALCDSLQATALQVVAEVRPGIAWSFMVDGRWPGLPLITKAGGFGSAGEVREILKEVSS
jgi:uncharacterized protein YgbK (DUF1537 family)